MNIAFLLASADQIGGMERVTIKIANELFKAGHNVSLISLYKVDKPVFEINDNIKTFYLFNKPNKLREKLPVKILRLRKILKTETFETLITVDTYLSFITIPATFGLNINKIFWEHFNTVVTFGRSSRNIARSLCSRHGHVVTLTERDKNYYKTQFNTTKVTSIPNPLPFDKPKQTSTLTEKNILAVGRLAHQKGFDMLLKSWESIHTEIPDWTLTIVGDGELKSELKELAEELDITKSVTFAGRQNNVQDFYRSSSLLVMSSRFEGLPMVLIESKFFGLPVVSFDCETGPAEIIDHGKDGLLVEKDNIEAFSKAILQMIKEEDLVKFSAKALENANKFDTDNIMKLWDNVLNEVSSFG